MNISRIRGKGGYSLWRAQDEGVVAVIGNVEDKGPRDPFALVRSFDSQAVKVSLNTGHARCDHGATGLMPAHAHLQDSDGFADRPWQTGRGSVMRHSVFGALAESPAMPGLLMELRKPAD